MKQNILLLASMAITAMAQANDVIVSDQTTPQRDNNIVLQQLVVSDLQQPAPISAMAEESYHVTFVAKTGEEFDFDSMFRPYAINKEGYYRPSRWELNDEGTEYTSATDMPAGTYDVIGLFIHLDAGHANGYDRSHWVILEDVTVNADCQIVLDPHQSTNHISFITYNPDGTETEMNLGRYIDKNWTYEIAKYGNVSSMTLVNSVIHKQLGALSVTYTSPSYREATEAIPTRSDGPKVFDVYVNPVSDKWEFKQTRFMKAQNDSAFVVGLHQSGSVNELDVLTNNADNYFELNYEYASSSVLDNLGEDCEMSYEIGFASTEEGGAVPSAQVVLGFASKLNALLVDPGCGPDEYPLYSLSFMRSVTDSDWNSYEDATPWIYVISPEDSFYSVFAEGNYAYGEYGQLFGKWYPGHSGLAVPVNGTKAFESTPFILMSYKEDWKSNLQRDRMYFAYDILSQTYDYRQTDDMATSRSITYNGEEILGDMDLDWSFPSEWVQEEHEPGEYVFTVVDSAFVVDDMTGKVEAKMVLDTRNSEHFPPAMQAFQIRNVNGELTNRFNSIDEIELRIVASDFNAVKQWNSSNSYYSMWYSYDPADLKIEVAPHSTGDYQTVGNAVTSDETYWGFGQFWKASLQGMTPSGADQWYDLRVTITDEVGNYQTQTFSPAFCLDQTTSAHTIETQHQQNGKMFRNKHLVIYRNGKQYNAYGQILPSAAEAM